MTHPIWRPVDELTLQSKRAIIRLDGSTTWAVVPSLWDQSSEALFGNNRSEAMRQSNAGERLPIDVTLMEIRSVIAETTRAELAQRRIHPRGLRLGFTPPFEVNEIRQLASTLLAQPDLADEFERRFSSWARMLATYLQAYDRTPHAVTLRNSPCPSCGIAQVIVDDDLVQPAILIDFHDGKVRAAQCRACGALWWRGPQLEQLAALLHTAAA